MHLSNHELLKNQCYINGQWCSAENNRTFDVTNPATGDVIAQVPKMGRIEALNAVQAASSAWQQWQKTTAKERSRILRRWFDLIIENKEDLGIILTSEQGKPLPESIGEVVYGANYLEWYAEEAKRVYGQTIPAQRLDERILVVKQSIGVCAAITPWNFPSAMIARKVAPALAAGCSFIVRPASQTPLSALAMAQLAHQAGVPAGVFNVLCGDAEEIGQVLTEHPDIKKFSFTGSTAVGRKLMAQCASTIKKVSLELGGNAPFIVFDDANLDKAVQGAMTCKFRNAGQTCVCANRFYVQENIYDAFVEQFKKAIQTLNLGNGLHKNVDCGPLINQKAVEKMDEHIADALAKGGTLECGGQTQTTDSLFYLPTLISHASGDMKVAKEETFAPLAAIFPFKDEAEVLTFANDTEYGLAAYVYSRDIGRITRMYEGLEYGMVGVNSGILSNEAAPFGGIKQSGIGREGAHYGIEDYLEIKYILLADLN